uniref:Galactose-3-O-sulfotransferase 4 n=1 Tax=Lepisosteus oculatus TaxID=7918 RepID=W5N5Y0_LEPOC|nr:PREDICTED: galactose-3-O-sulfotransferase 4-like isoform X1 [Lepisosteus oculatus]
MAFRRTARRMRWLGCCRLGLLWKALVLFVAIGFAGQLLGVNKSLQLERPAPFSAGDPRHPLRLLADASAPCRPHTHVMFLKTHKTASSTVLNMLYRFGEERGLRFALPLGYQFGYPLRFSAHRVKGYRGPGAVEFSIMGNHMRFNKKEVEKVMPPDTFYFSILRDPALLAESSYTYYKAVAPAFRRAKGLADFIDDPWRHYDPRLRNNHYARNLLWFDFGLPHDANFTAELARAGEAEVRRSFQLVLLAEHFDQSMVLLRHALCWPLDAVVSFSLNARQQRAGSSVRPALSEKQRQKLREWNALDWHLYRAFNQTFWAQVERFGRERMDREVGALRSRREELAQLCLRDGGQPVEASRIQDKAIRPFQSGLVKILGYELQPGLVNLTRDFCLRLVRPEIQYKDVLDSKQFPRPPGPAATPKKQSPKFEKGGDRQDLQIREQKINQTAETGKGGNLLR